MVGLAVAAISLGHLVTVVEPRTTVPICARVAHIGEGAGGIATVWAVQIGGSRLLKMPLAEVSPGCSDFSEAGPAKVAAEASEGVSPASGKRRPATAPPDAPARLPASSQPVR